MELGLGLQSDKRPDDYVAVARKAEEAGFDVLSVYHDLLYQPAIAPLLLMAQATERIRLGPSGLNPHTLHPVEIAGQVAALDAVSNGRAYLGLVQGAWLDRLGLSEDRPLTAMREAVEIIRRLFAGDSSGFAGERYTLAPGAGLNYEPLRRELPLLIGTWGRRTAAFAGTCAFELKLGGCANPDVIPVVREWIGNDDVGIVVGSVTVVDEDGALARARAQAEVAMYTDVIGRLDPTLELRPGQEPPLDCFAFAGTPDQVAEHAQRMLDAGAKRVEFGTPQGVTFRKGIDLLADRVLPLLRR